MAHKRAFTHPGRSTNLNQTILAAGVHECIDLAHDPSDSGMLNAQIHQRFGRFLLFTGRRSAVEGRRDIVIRHDVFRVLEGVEFRQILKETVGS